MIIALIIDPLPTTVPVAAALTTRTILTLIRKVSYEAGMPRLLTELFSTRIPKPTRVAWMKEEGTRFLRVRFEGEALEGARFAPGMDVELRLGDDRVFRHQTPALFDAAAGAMELVFFVCGEGPGSAWVRTLHEGCEVSVIGPRGGLPVDPYARYHVFLGDESCVGLEECLARSVRDGACWTSALETRHAPPSCARWIRAGEDGGDSVHRFLARQPRTSTFYLAGEARSIQAWRRRLLALGVARRFIRTKACGIDGRQAS